MKLFVAPEKTISGISHQIRSGKRSCVEVLEKCLSRIDELESRVRAWVRIDRQGASARAEELDADLEAGEWRGPLHGIPIGIKDIVDVAGMPTAAGSRLWADRVATEDATIVARLRAAGAVILGKTVTTQYACFDPPVTRNPWNLDRTPGGSSSGSAAAVACGMCLGAVGSQTGGSITRPASYCGVAGCKPSYGRVSTHGILPLAPSMDHPGPFARTVRDLAILLEAVAGPDRWDPICLPQPSPEICRALDTKPPSPPRLGRLGGLFSERADEAVRESFDLAIATLASAGATMTQQALPPTFDQVPARHRTVMAVEAAAWHEGRLAENPDDYLPKIRQLIEEGLQAPAPEYARCRQHQALLGRAMLACFNSVDVLICPATTSPAPDTTTTGDPALNSPWSYTRLPTVSFPISLSPDGLPLAIQLVGRPFGEVDLFRAAAWCEQAIHEAY